MGGVELRTAFGEEFGGAPRVFSAPGRVNLIGEHTDYNEGFVLPAAIERRTWVAAAPRADRCLCVVARDLDARARVSLDGERVSRQGEWLAYVEGVARVLELRGHRLTGANLMIHSTVPVGAGLSSSAALEVAVGRALTALAGVELPGVELACAAQRAEHDYAGTRCGIMDQYIVTLGQPDHALLLDCRSLERTPVLARFDQAALLICDSRVKHDLATSAYNERRAECERGVEFLAERHPGVRALRDLTVDELSLLAELPELTQRRCRHVVTENARTLAAAEALGSGDLDAMGQLMKESHRSLAEDYEVSCPELDLLVETACSQPGVYGSRLTGAGFGGCTISLVADDAVERVSHAITEVGRARFAREPVVFATRACGGVRED